MLKVLIATGGTGGHLFPAQKLQKDLSDCEVLFAGHKLKCSPFFNQKMAYREIASASSKKNPLSLLKGFFQSLKLIWSFQPDVVVGFGSFHSFPVLLAAIFLRKKVVVYEANCSLGKVNAFFAPFAKALALQFPLHEKRESKKVQYVHFSKRNLPIPMDRARRDYGLDLDLFTILVFGGSQGAQFINHTFHEAASLFSFPFQVIHLTGKGGKELAYRVPSVVKEFEEEMEMAYSAANLVVSRCGAGTVAELIHFQKPSLLIPYPFAYDHQRINGLFLGEGGKILLQKETTAQRLAAEIEEIKLNLDKHKRALSQVNLPKTIHFSELVYSVGGKK